MDKLFANSGDPDQTPHSAASDLGQHCLSIIYLGVSRPKLLAVLESHGFLGALHRRSKFANFVMI